MAATLTLQSDDGDVDGANTYNSLVTFKAYADDHGYSYAGKTDDQISVALIKAADYIDTRFLYKGSKLNGDDQDTQFPREDLFDRDGNEITGLPKAVKRAHNEYAYRALSTALYQDAPMPDGGRPIIQESITTGPVTTNQTFASPQVMTIILGEFPAADRLLIAAGFVRNTTQGSVDR